MKCTLIGHPLGHSLSPDIHTRLFAISGTRGEYDLTDIPKELLEEKVEYLKSVGRLPGYKEETKEGV